MEQKTYNPQLIANARSLRCEMSPAERRLWFDGLKTLDIRFRRQRPVGRYIVDFYCAKAKLVVEIDGNTHDSDAAQKYDAERTMYLQSLGMMVARFSNADVLQNLEGVLVEIRGLLEERIGVESMNRTAANPSVGRADISPAGQGRLTSA